MIKNIIFDWGGVINDNTIFVYKSVLEIFKIFGAKKISFEEFRREWEQPYMKFYNKYLPNLTLEAEKKAFLKSFIKFNQKPYMGIVKILKKFYKKNINLFIISSDPTETIFPQIENFGLNGLFKEIFCDVHNKINPTSKLIRNYNLVSNQTIIIGDSNHEIEAGKKVGIKTGAVTWGICSEKKLKSLNPDYIIHNLAELNKIILN